MPAHVRGGTSGWIVGLLGGPFGGKRLGLAADERLDGAPEHVYAVKCPCCEQIVVADGGWSRWPLVDAELLRVRYALSVDGGETRIGIYEAAHARPE